MLNEVNANLKERNIELVISKKVKKFLADKGYDEKFGARFLRKTIIAEIEDKLAFAMLKGSIQNYGKINVGVKGRSLYFKQTEKSDKNIVTDVLRLEDQLTKKK